MDLYFIPDLIHDFFVDFNFITLFIFLFIIIFYLVFCFVIFDMYKSLYGKNNYLSWVPIINVYVLGDLLFGKTIGYSLCGGFILISLLNTFVNENFFILLLSIIYIISLLGMFGFAIYRYIDLKRNKTNNSMVSNTLDLGADSISPVKTNGPTESMINNVNVIPTNDISNINSVPVQNTFVPTINNLDANFMPNQDTNIADKINDVGLFNNNNVKPVQNVSTNLVEEKHYEMPKLILEASENNNIKKVDSDVVNSKTNNNNENTNLESEEEKMKFITGIEDDEKIKFVTGDKVINSLYSNGNMAPKEEEITVVNGVINSSNNIKTEEEEKMNIVNGTIIPNQSNNNQNISNDSILDLNKKL